MSYAFVNFSYKLPLHESPITIEQAITENGLSGKFSNYDPSKSLGKSRHLGAATKLLSSTAIKLNTNKDIAQHLEQSPSRVGVFIVGENVNLDDDFNFDLCAAIYGPDYVSPLKAPNTLANAIGSHYARFSLIKGPNCTISASNHGVNQALDMAILNIDNGAIDIAIIGATEVTSKYHQALKESSRELSTTCAIRRSTPDDRLHFYPPIFKRKPNYSEQCIELLLSEEVAKIATQCLDKSIVDMVWVSSGSEYVDFDKFSTTLAANGVSDSLANVEALLGRGECGNELLSLQLASEILPNKTNLLDKHIYGDKPQAPATVAFVSLTADQQFSVLVMEAN